MAKTITIFTEAAERPLRPHRQEDAQDGQTKAAEITAAPDYMSLATVHRRWGCPPTDDQIRLLLDYGIDGEAMTQPYPLGGAKVRFNGYTFDIDSKGQDAVTFRAEDRGEVIDLVAWNPDTSELASWQGAAFCLGDADQIFNPATFFMSGALHVHRSPIEWLRADRAGIVIIRPDLCHAYLRYTRRLAFADVHHALEVKAWLQPRVPPVELLVQVPAERPA
jgi:hypothetical protein